MDLATLDEFKSTGGAKFGGTKVFVLLHARRATQMRAVYGLYAAKEGAC